MHGYDNEGTKAGSQGSNLGMSTAYQAKTAAHTRC